MSAATESRDRDRVLLVDTHAHLQWPSLAADVEAVLDRARDAGVVRILTLGTDVASSCDAVSLAASHPAVYAAVGIHPGDVPADLDAALGAIERLLDHPKVVAIGETGLDYYHADNPPRDRQLAAFAGQLEMARHAGKPVCIHNREAGDDVLRVLSGYAGDAIFILHCFTGDRAMARAALDLGCYVSFAGNATYPKLRDLLNVTTDLPATRLLVETDAPFLAPQPRRGSRNEPANVVHTYDAIARERGETRADVARAVASNASRLFAWTDEDAA